MVWGCPTARPLLHYVGVLVRDAGALMWMCGFLAPRVTSCMHGDDL
jgi:hypothetical protein